MPAEWFWNRALNSWGHPFANGYACLISEGQYQRDGPLTRCPVCGWHPTPPPPPIPTPDQLYWAAITEDYVPPKRWI
jgi:hypothetical protein